VEKIMRKTIFAVVIILVATMNCFSQDKNIKLPFKQIVSEGNELKVNIDINKIKRVVICVDNLLDKESIFYRSAYFKGKERPENEIGPKSIRTYILDPQITDENVKIRNDRKTIVLNTTKMNEIYLKVEKGKVEIEITEEKKKI